MFRPPAMLAVSLVLFLQYVQCFQLKIIPEPEQLDNDYVLPCIANITRHYFSKAKNMYYLEPNPDSNMIKFLNSLELVSFNSKTYFSNTANPNLAYMMVFRDLDEFLLHISELILESNWDPQVRFLVVIKTLGSEELRHVFDSLLRQRVYNVVVLNGTITTELYTYNPFEKYACGNYYTRVIYYGKCAHVTADIYPNKVITGLKNCFFNVSIPDWPPYGIDYSKRKLEDKRDSSMGTEEYIFHLISEIEQFKYKSDYDFDSETFSTVSKNMTISGPMERLAHNRSSFMLGGLMLIPSRAKAFSYINGHLDYIDEIKLMVKIAGPAPPWKDIYLEFNPLIWALILLVLFLYSALLIALLRAKDKGHIILMLLDGLLSHGSRFHSRQSVKCVVIIWVIFAYLINSFYTTSLVSLTMKPVFTYQIRDEQTAIDRGLEPCISFVMGRYLKAEENHGEILEDAEIGTEGCEKFLESIKTVSKSDRLFTIVVYSIYAINKQQFYDEWGHRTVFSFAKPYTKVIYAMYFNKGFPMRDRLHKLALRIREVGLSEKSLNDHYYVRSLQYRFRSPEFVARFAMPWYLYGIGVSVSTIAFVVENTLQYNKVAPVSK